MVDTIPHSQPPAERSGRTVTFLVSGNRYKTIVSSFISCEEEAWLRSKLHVSTPKGVGALLGVFFYRGLLEVRHL